MANLSYFIRLLANLNENTMVNLAAPHLLAFLGLLTCGMMMYLSILIFRADPTNPKNRFLSFILAFEGFGAGALNFLEFSHSLSNTWISFTLFDTLVGRLE